MESSSLGHYQTVKSVVQRALAHFNLHPAPGVIYHLLFEGRLLVDTKTLQQEGVKDGSVLLLGTEAPVGVKTETTKRKSCVIAAPFMM